MVTRFLSLSLSLSCTSTVVAWIHVQRLTLLSQQVPYVQQCDLGRERLGMHWIGTVVFLQSSGFVWPLPANCKLENLSAGSSIREALFTSHNYKIQVLDMIYGDWKMLPKGWEFFELMRYRAESLNAAGQMKLAFRALKYVHCSSFFHYNLVRSPFFACRFH